MCVSAGEGGRAGGVYVYVCVQICKSDSQICTIPSLLDRSKHYRGSVPKHFKIFQYSQRFCQFNFPKPEVP